MTDEATEGRTLLLLARSAIAAPPLKEMRRLRDVATRLPGVTEVSFAFSEQGLRPSGK